MNVIFDVSTISLLTDIYAIPADAFLAISMLIIFILMALVILLIVKIHYTGNINKLLYIDTLTGLWTLDKFRKEAGRILEEQNCSGSYALLYLNIKKFKYLNDTYGYVRGDEVLKMLAEILENVAGDDGMVARSHADHFLALLHFADFTQLDEQIKNILESFDGYLLSNGFGRDIAVSMGAYVLRESDSNISTALDRANYAREADSGAYKSRCVYYTSDMLENIKRDKELERDMEYAMDNSEFVVYYQPKTDLMSGKIIGAEALVRWNHHDRGLISPGAFIPLFECNGFIVKLDMYVFESVCATIKKWLSEGKSVMPVSVNFSKCHLADGRFAQKLSEIVKKYGISTDLLEAEITESMAVDDLELVVFHINRLRQEGFSVAIDDFGAGHSSLELLRLVEVDVLKIDKGFLDGDTFDSRNLIILNSLISLARKLNIQVVCEGVEVRAQADVLKQFGCHAAQGFLYCRPIPVAVFEANCFY